MVITVALSTLEIEIKRMLSSAPLYPRFAFRMLAKVTQISSPVFGEVFLPFVGTDSIPTKRMIFCQLMRVALTFVTSCKMSG